MELLREENIDYTVDEHIGKPLDSDGSNGRFMNKLLTSRSFMAAIKTLVRPKTTSAIVVQNTAISEPSKKEPLATMEAYSDIVEALPSQLGSRIEEPQCHESSRRQFEESSCEAWRLARYSTVPVVKKVGRKNELQSESESNEEAMYVDT